MSSSVGSCLSCCQRGEEELLGVRTGYGRDCHIESAIGPSVSAGSEGGVWGAHFGRSIGAWIRLGSSVRSCWNCVSMSGVGLSVSVSSWSPSGDGGAGLVEEGGAGRSNCAGRSQCLLG